MNLESEVNNNKCGNSKFSIVRSIINGLKMF